MRSVQPSVRTARAIILEEALRLFAERGEDAVTIRQIAERAEVSPGLVIHHFGSKAALSEAVVGHVRQWMDELMDEAGQPQSAADLVQSDVATLGSFLESALPQGSPIPAYLRRLFLAGNPAATELLRGWHEVTVAVFRAWQEAGLLDEGPDLEMRAAVTMSADLGVIFLREQWREVLGVDPLGSSGVQRYTAEALRVFDAVLPAGPPPPSDPPSPPGKES